MHCKWVSLASQYCAAKGNNSYINHGTPLLDVINLIPPRVKLRDGGHPGIKRTIFKSTGAAIPNSSRMLSVIQAEDVVTLQAEKEVTRERRSGESLMFLVNS